MKKIWNIISEIGIYPELSQIKAGQTRLFNRIIILTLLVINLQLFVSFTFDFPPMWLQYVTTFVICVGILMFHYYKKYEIPLFVACLLYPAYIVFVMIYHEPTYAESGVFILNILFSMIVFQGQKKMIYLTTTYNIVLCTLSFYYLQSISGNKFIDHNPYDNIIINFALAIITFLMVLLYQREISKISDQRKGLISRLEEKNKELESFAYVTSHDLKEPVRTIGSFAGLLRKKVENNQIGKENKQLIAEIEHSAHNLSHLIDSILEYSKLDSDQTEILTVDLNDVINNFKSSHKILLEETKATIQYNELPQVNGNKILLSLLFQNLIENGIKFNTSDQPKIKIDSTEKENHFEVIIADNGIGIDEKFKDLIFEPFKRLKSRNHFKGSGLGLSVCKKIVESHNGHIWLNSTPGEGSTFHITLEKPKSN